MLCTIMVLAALLLAVAVAGGTVAAVAVAVAGVLHKFIICKFRFPMPCQLLQMLDTKTKLSYFYD